MRIVPEVDGPVAPEPSPPSSVSSAAPDRAFRFAFGVAFVGFLALVFVPMCAVFAQGLLFGGDWGQYVLTSQLYVSRQSNMLYYPEPVLPLLYLPATAAWGTSLAVAYFADVVGGVLLVLLLLASYVLFREVVGSRWGALTGALLFATSPLIMDEVGWAGQAQYLAILLGILATWVLFRKVVAEGRERWAIVAGALLALAVLSESYTALFFLVFLVAWFLLVYRRAVLTRRPLLRAVATFGLPLVALLGVGLANAALARGVIAEPLVARAAYLPLYRALYFRFGFENHVLQVLYPSILIAYVLLWRRLEVGQPGYRWFVPALVIAWIPQFLLFTPVVDTDRSLYFAFLPAAAMLAEVARALPAAWRRSVSGAPARVYRTRWGAVPRGRRSVVPIFAVIAVVTLGVQAGVSTHTYYQSLTYYSYNSGVLSELEGLGSKNGSLLLVTPDLGNFAAAWSSGRNTFFGPPSQPATYTRVDQQEAVIVGNQLAYGASWLGAGNTWAIDAEPYWGDPAPLILQYTGYYLFQSLEMNDSTQWVEFGPALGSLPPENVSLFSAPSIVHAVNPTNLTTTYSWTGLTVTKTIASDADGNILLSFRYVTDGTILHQIGLSLVLPNPRPTHEVTYASALPSSLRVTQVLKNGFLPFAFPNTVDVAAPGSTGTTTYVPETPSSLGEIATEIAPGASNTTSLEATITISPVDLSSPPATVTSERSVLATNGISWVAVERSMGVRFLERFLADPNFTLYDSTPHYLIFETVWS